MLDTRFETVTLVLALLAIIFALIQFRDSKKQNEKMEDVAGRMNDIAKSMSTQFVGLFPKNMDSITSVVGKADKQLDIMVDFVGYGHYSDPEEFSRYLAAIKDARQEGVEVRMLIYGEDAALKSQGSQYSQFKEHNFQDKEMKCDRFQHFFGECYPGVKTPQTWCDFNAVIDGFQLDFQRDLLQKGIQIRVVSEMMLMFAWIEDKQEAVFAFLNSGENYRELSFRTQDANLIAVFVDRFESAWTSGKKLSAEMTQERPSELPENATEALNGSRGAVA
jgi:hypothetical protein